MFSTKITDEHTNMNEVVPLLLEELPVASLLIGSHDFKIEFANKAACQLLGYKKDELYHLNYLDLFVEDFRIIFLQSISAQLKKFNCTGSQYKKNGQIFSTELFATSIEFEGREFYQITALEQTVNHLENPEILQETNRYRTYIEQSTEGIFCQEITVPVPISLPFEKIIELVIQNSYISECNTAMAKMYGFESNAQLKGIMTNQLIDLNENANYEYFSNFIQNGFRSVNAESLEKDRYGNPCYFLNNAIGIVEDGLLKRIWGTQRDITKEKKINNELRFLANMVEQTSDVLTAADMDFKPVTWNKAAERMYGLTAEQVIGKDLRNFISIDYLNHSREEVRSILSSKGEWRGEARFERNNDHKLITVIIGFKILKDQDGSLLGHLISATDITERKENESRLSESEHRFREMADSSPAIIWMTDEGNRIIYVNKECVRYTGRESFIDVNDWTNIIHPDDVDKAKNDFYHAFNSRQPITLIYRMRRHDGSYRWVQDVSTPRNFQDDSFLGYIGSIVDIEDQKQKQEQLLYQATILENVSDIIVTTDLNFNVRVWNKIAEKYYGIKTVDAIGKRMSELVKFQFYNTTQEESVKELQKNSIWRGEVSIVNTEGHKIYFSHTVKHVLDEYGNKIGFLAIGRDISDRKIIEEKLAKSEEFYRTLIADSLDGILLTDSEGLITFVSPSVKNVLGYDVKEVLGKNAFEFVHPDDIVFALESFQKEVVENPEIKYIVVRLKTKSGDWLWCMVRGHNMLQKQAVQSIVIYFHDDSLRKQATEALKESEKRFRTLISDMHTGVLLQDASGNILMSNNAMYRMFDVTEDDLVGNKIWKIYSDTIHENGLPFKLGERPNYKVLLTKKLVADIVMGVMHPVKRERIWLNVTADPVLNDKGDLVHIISSFTNITERKKMDQEMLAKQINHQKQLTQASIDGQENERKEIGKELHDNIGQQLTTIKLFLDLAKSTADENTAEMINMSLKGISDVINDIRAMSRSLVPSTLKDLGLIESVNELIESIERTQVLELAFDHEKFRESLIPENQKLTLFRIIQEQMNNVVKYADAKLVNIQLAIHENEVILTIKDDGKGFDMKSVRKGLGFINMENRAQLFEGKTEINTGPGKGCRLTVTMPFNVAKTVV